MKKYPWKKAWEHLQKLNAFTEQIISKEVVPDGSYYAIRILSLVGQDGEAYTEGYYASSYIDYEGRWDNETQYFLTSDPTSEKVKKYKSYADALHAICDWSVQPFHFFYKDIHYSYDTRKKLEAKAKKARVPEYVYLTERMYACIVRVSQAYCIETYMPVDINENTREMEKVNYFNDEDEK